MTLDTIISIARLVILLAVIIYLFIKVGKTLAPIMKNKDFWAKAINAIAEAEELYPEKGTGALKLSYVKEFLLDYCITNDIDFTEADIVRIVNLIVAAANLIKKFVAGV